MRRRAAINCWNDRVGAGCFLPLTSTLLPLQFLLPSLATTSSGDVEIKGHERALISDAIAAAFCVAAFV